MRNYLIAANWKMYKSTDEMQQDLERLSVLVAAEAQVDVAVAVSSLGLAGVPQRVRSLVGILGQNGMAEDEGAFTGEVSLKQMQPFVDGVILGHSERRHLFGETDVLIMQKVRSAFEKHMHVILCVGETREQRERGQFESVVEAQIKAVLDVVEEYCQSSHWDGSVPVLDIAYEPVWAISGGDAAVQPATEDEIAAAHLFMHTCLSEYSSLESVRLLYGGSVKPENAARILALPHVQGALVGSASLDPERFMDIVRAVPRS